MEQNYTDSIPTVYPLGIQVGSKTTSLGFHGEIEHGLALNLSGQDSENFYSILSGLGGDAPENIPNSDYGEELQYIIDTDILSNQYSQVISTAFNNGANSTGANYPDTNLGDQLKTVARLIRGGIETKVFMVKLGGFDTHNNQNQASGDIQGKHRELMTELSGAIESFMTDLNADNLADDVLGVTFSEFGRKAKENGSLGTDHGEVAPMFAFGKPVKSGVSGINVDLSEAVETNNYQVQTVQHDYRETFATIMQDFLGANNSVIDSTFLENVSNESFVSSKITDLIKTDCTVPEDCYSEALTIPVTTLDNWSVFPNPFKTSFFIISENHELETHFELRNQLSQRVLKGVLMFRNGKATINARPAWAGASGTTLPRRLQTVRLDTDRRALTRGSGGGRCLCHPLLCWPPPRPTGPPQMAGRPG